MIKDYFYFGLKNLRRRGVRSWLTLLGILIGIAAVVSLITLGQGLKAVVNAQFGVDSTELITVQAGGISGYGPPGTGVIDSLTAEDAEAIAKLDTVERAIKRNMVSFKVEFNNKLIFGYGTSVPDGENRDAVYELTGISPIAGRLLKDGDTNKVALGYNFYDEKNEFGKQIRPGNNIIVQGEKFEVTGIAKKKGSFLFDNVVYMNEEPLKELLNLSDKVDIIIVKVKNKDLMAHAKEDIEGLLRQRRNVAKGEENFEVSTPEATLQTVNQILGGIQMFIVLIAAISIFVGAIGIINTMAASVLERRKEIGIMKAIGAKNRDIFIQFLIEAGLLGLVGGIMGIAIGIIIGVFGILAVNDFMGASIKPQIDLFLITGALAGSFVIGAVSGILPAMNAAKQHPVDALRG